MNLFSKGIIFLVVVGGIVGLWYLLRSSCTEDGKYTDSEGNCVKCPANSYCPGGEKEDCGSDETSKSGSTKKADCSKQCSSGKYRSGRTCLTCPENNYCKNNTKTPCGQGKVSSSGSSDSSDCKAPTPSPPTPSPPTPSPPTPSPPTPPPSQQNNPGNLGDSCSASNPCQSTYACKSGICSVKDATNEIQCTCTNGDCGTDKTKCDTCDNGYYLSNGECKTCEVGYYCTGGKLTRSSCGSGKTTQSTGSSSQSQCITSHTTTTICPKGEELTSSGCEPCPRGKYNSQQGGTCVDCGDGKFCGTEGMISDGTWCPPGTEQSYDKAYCEQCPRGKYNSQQGGTCVDCGSGKFCGTKGMISDGTWCQSGTIPSSDKAYCETFDARNNFTYLCPSDDGSFQIYHDPSLTSSQRQIINEKYPGKDPSYYACAQGCSGSCIKTENKSILHP